MLRQTEIWIKHHANYQELANMSGKHRKLNNNKWLSKPINREIENVWENSPRDECLCLLAGGIVLILEVYQAFPRLCMSLSQFHVILARACIISQCEDSKNLLPLKKCFLFLFFVSFLTHLHLFLFRLVELTWAPGSILRAAYLAPWDAFSAFFCSIPVISSSWSPWPLIQVCIFLFHLSVEFLNWQTILF